MSVAVLIPSYRRPKVLRLALPSWLRGRRVRYVVVTADSPLAEEIEEYKQVLALLKDRYSDIELIYDLYRGRRGSVKARNELLDLADKLNVSFAVMADDDYVLPSPSFTEIMALHLEKYSHVGAVGGRVVVVRRRRIDPDFFLNAPINLADPLSKFTGYVFLDTLNGPRYAEFLTHFYMLRREVLKSVRYDLLFESPTAFREESDVHVQIKKLGYKLLLDPRVYVLHLAMEEGGDRPSMSMAQRIYWKARNHTVFILKHFKPTTLRLWYLFTSTLVLTLYRPWHTHKILRGLSDGLRYFTSRSVSKTLDAP